MFYIYNIKLGNENRKILKKLIEIQSKKYCLKEKKMVCVLATLKVKEDKTEKILKKFSKILVKMFAHQRVIFFIKLQKTERTKIHI